MILHKKTSMSLILIAIGLLVVQCTTSQCSREPKISIENTTEQNQWLDWSGREPHTYEISANYSFQPGRNSQATLILLELSAVVDDQRHYLSPVGEGYATSIEIFDAYCSGKIEGAFTYDFRWKPNPEEPDVNISRGHIGDEFYISIPRSADDVVLSLLPSLVNGVDPILHIEPTYGGFSIWNWTNTPVEITNIEPVNGSASQVQVVLPASLPATLSSCGDHVPVTLECKSEFGIEVAEEVIVETNQPGYESMSIRVFCETQGA